MKKVLACFLLALLPFVLFAQLKSPESFLGYPLGQKFTPHFKIVQYFNHVAVNAVEKVQLQIYGKTNEGRELLVAIVSSPENISSLEEIRKNNLRLTGLLSDKAATVNNKNIIWLSYNVHGNEASSSEVAMKALYELTSGQNLKANDWLKNTIVIIDPCLNPDGRDRYVNWYNSIVGKNGNASQLAREHSEPWPGGRSNHYNFDLNRDWAWQTQVESSQRMKLYHEWMPQIHADFHEQYYNSPYYFAPAAEPFHAKVTDWQRQSQTEIGRNHARYFDENGWLYFTKESFDLLYPSYGDTYPIFNGSIGMTYEQAGHGRSGLAIAVDKYDTLHLTDRIAHHYTTSMSTIEYASKNAAKLQDGFKKYFENALSGKSANYQTYILSGGNKGKMASLISLLEKNKIRYNHALKNQPVSGYNYFSKKNESYITSEKDIVISSAQPQSVLLNVLFDAAPILSDTATYDITAWAIPFAYGINTIATNQKVNVTSKPLEQQAKLPANAYAYVIDYSSFQSAKLLAALLKNGFRVRFSEQEFTVNNEKFGKGSLIVTSANNTSVMGSFDHLVQQFPLAKIASINTGFMDSGFDMGSSKMKLISKPTVALVTGAGTSSLNAGELWHLFDEELDYPLTLINAEDIENVRLNEIDVLIFPDGNYGLLAEKGKSESLKKWVRQGGRIIAMEGAVTEMARGEWGLQEKKAEDAKDKTEVDEYKALRKYKNRERDGLTGNIPGAIYKVELDVSHPLAFGYEADYFVLKTNGSIFQFSSDAWNVGVLPVASPFSGFVGSEVKSKLKNGTLIAVQEMGAGSVVYFADNPIFRSFWENGKQMLANAIFLVGN